MSFKSLVHCHYSLCLLTPVGVELENNFYTIPSSHLLSRVMNSLFMHMIPLRRFEA